MCGRYALSADPDELIEVFEIDQLTGVDGETHPAGHSDGGRPDWLAPHYNIAPTQTVPAVLRPEASEHGRALVGLRWGLVPSWSKGPGSGPNPINARLETAAEKPSFRAAAARRRCLLPADGYYEWYRTGGTGSAAKQPYFIRPVVGGPMAMAGLFEFWRTPAGEWLASCAILTTSASDELGHIHDRMPVQVARENWADWLDRSLTDARAALSLVHVPEGHEMTAHPVSTEVNKVGNDSAALEDPLPGGPDPTAAPPDARE